MEVSALYWAVVVAAVLWEKEPEPWETTGATELPYIPEGGCPPCTLLPTDPEQTAHSESEGVKSH